MRHQPTSKPATRNYHPAKHRKKAPARTPASSAMRIPLDRDNAEIAIAGKTVALTNLRKVFWPDLGITKGDLLQFYAAIAPVLLPHLENRAMVMKRYPHGIAG